MSGNRTIYSDVRRINLKVLNTVFEEPVCMTMPLLVCKFPISQTRLVGTEGMKEAETVILYPSSTPQRLFQISR